MKPFLKYPGAKNRIANWICEYIPPHDVYLEPYFGSGSVFFNKTPAKIETINDLDNDVVNYFRVLREKPNELIELLKLTPFSREEYNNAFEYNENDSDVERARKFAVRCWQGFGCSIRYKNGFRSSQQKNSPETTKEWQDIPERIKVANKRLLHAQIENLPAIELIKRYYNPDVFIYCDPPYLHGIRKKYLYKHEMTDDQHEELLKLLIKHPGKILISGYDNEMYNEYLSGWYKVQKNTQVECGLKRTETLWMNYEIAQQQKLLLVK